MKNKDVIYNKLIELNDNNGIDALTLSNLLGMSRANVSHELNSLYKEGKVEKSNSRPVKFFIHKTEQKETTQSELDKLAKNNISMLSAIEQAKAAVLYPPKGMNCLILGETGVGKSMFANLMYGYAIEMGIKAKDSPFIVFNCADYSNNPQLLTSQLFGVKKGAYTGAEADRSGLIEQANGGILFLDEVHRLPPEGQEALFIFLDTQKFRRVGDSETRTSDVLIISATTENPNSALLSTFTRRIPMVISIPALRERTLEERLHLIKNFFKDESIRLNKEIYVSLNSIRALLSYDCPNNIGQLKSDIQLICAKAYSKFLTNLKSDVRVYSGSLPTYIRDGLYKAKEHRSLWNKLIGEEIEYFKFTANYEQINNSIKNKDMGIYSFIETKLEKLQSQGISDIDIECILEKDIGNYFTHSTDNTLDEITRNNLSNVIDGNVLRCFDLIVEYLSKNLKRTLNNNIYTAFALHINTLVTRIKNNKPIVNNNLFKIKDLYPNEFDIALHVKEILEENLKISIPMDETGYLTLFLVPEMQFNSEMGDKVKIILIAHGESTATSMSNVANKLLGEDYVLSINAPIEVSPADVLTELRKTVKKNFSSEGYLLLVDMGSLTTFGEVIEREFNVPVKVISLVSTLHVLEAARKALMGLSLSDIFKDVLMVNSYIDIHKNSKDDIMDKKKTLIITACLTGEGGSVAIKSFLDNNLKYDKNLFEIMVLNCLDKNYFKENINKLKLKNDILFIVTPFNIDLDVKQYSMYDVLNMSVKNEIQELIDIETTLLQMPSILKETIGDLDCNELFDDINDFLIRLENSLSIKILDKKKVGLILHIAYTINRLRNNESLSDYPDKDDCIKNNSIVYSAIKESFKYLQNKYFINITDDEICYIVNFINN
jgi:transcriptional regulatory protein LevR/transcriptional regulator with AAA-type ATPase domain